METEIKNIHTPAGKAYVRTLWNTHLVEAGKIVFKYSTHVIADHLRQAGWTNATGTPFNYNMLMGMSFRMNGGRREGRPSNQTPLMDRSSRRESQKKTVEGEDIATAALAAEKARQASAHEAVLAELTQRLTVNPQINPKLAKWHAALQTLESMNKANRYPLSWNEPPKEIAFHLDRLLRSVITDNRETFVGGPDAEKLGFAQVALGLRSFFNAPLPARWAFKLFMDIDAGTPLLKSTPTSPRIRPPGGGHLMKAEH